MYYCDKCGKEREDLPIVRQYHGETSLGDKLLEPVTSDKCSCGGVLRRKAKCRICGNYPNHISARGICEDCFYNYETIDTALEIGEEESFELKVEINGFIAESLSKAQINKILTKWVKENLTDGGKEVTEYLRYDYVFDRFVEYIEEKEDK